MICRHRLPRDPTTPIPRPENPTNPERNLWPGHPQPPRWKSGVQAHTHDDSPDGGKPLAFAQLTEMAQDFAAKQLPILWALKIA